MQEQINTVQLANDALSSLSRRHGVQGIPYVLSANVQQQFGRAIDIAAKALAGCVERSLTNRTGLSSLVSEALSAPEVTSEISNLLDPGLEVFDQLGLTGILARFLPDTISHEAREEIAFHAWEEFLRAFSFASRSLPELREFLRASYEAGTFRRVSDIAGAVKDLESGLSEFSRQESSLQSSMAAYFGELQGYRNWAHTNG